MGGNNKTAARLNRIIQVTYGGYPNIGVRSGGVCVKDELGELGGDKDTERRESREIFT